MLDEWGQGHDGAAQTAAGRGVPFGGSDLAARVLRGWPVVLAAGVLGGGLAYGWSLCVTPAFVSTTEIFIDPRSIQALDTPANQAQGDNNAQVSFVESQARVVTSEGVLARVVASGDLAGDPLFNGEGAATSPSGLARRLGLLGPDPHPPADRTRAALMALADRVTVRRPERTFVMDVSVKADTADKAASLANAVAQAYFDEQTAARAEMAHRAAAALTGRLDQLRDRVQQAEGKVQAFKTEHGLVGTRAQLSSEQQLVDANAQLAQAQSRVVLAQARLGQAQSLPGAPAEGDTPEAVASPVIALLRGQQAEAKRRLDKASEQFGPRHPAVRDARAELDGLNRSVASELARIGQAARVEYRRATAAAAAQKATVDRLSVAAQQTSSALLELNQLEREVDINKNLLDTFLSRSRQINELGDLDTTDGRVISTALPPPRRAFPPRGAVVGLLGTLLGLVAGAWLAARPWTRRDARPLTDAAFGRPAAPPRTRTAQRA